MNKNTKNILIFNGVYGTAHFLIDCICIFILFTLSFYRPIMQIFDLIILYNVLAFGLQVPLGILVDKYKNEKNIAAFSFILISIAIVYREYVIISVILAGIANALFHVAGGSISLNINPGRATVPGMFIAPGAVGLFVGGLLAKFVPTFGIYFIVLSLILAIFMFISRIQIKNVKIKEIKLNKFELILFLLVIAILVRSLVGSLAVFSWKANLVLSIILIASVFCGKFFGGIVADRVGWRKTALLCLLISLPILSLFSNSPFVAICAMFLFNMVTPITIAALSNLFPGRGGFVFGLNCLALLIGFLLSLYSFASLAGNAYFIGALIAIAIISIYFSLRERYLNKK